MAKIAPMPETNSPRAGGNGYESDESSNLFEDDGGADSGDERDGYRSGEEEVEEVVNIKHRKGKGRNKREPVSSLLKKRNEIRAMVVKDVLEKIMPDIGAYDVDGTTQARKENEAGTYIIRWLKFLGLMEMDLHDAVLTGSIHRVRGSIRKLTTGKNPQPALINQYDQNGYTPLSLAVKVNDAEIVSALLEAGAQPDLVDEVSGRTPIFFSIQLHSPGISEQLVRSGASVNMPDFKCITPLMVAAAMKDLTHCRLLVANYAELDAQDENGWTALHYGVMSNAVKCVAFLLAEGADRSIRDLHKRRPVHIAKFKQYGECEALLDSRNRQLA